MVRKDLLFLVCFLTVFASVNGCGQLPQRQGLTINFNVTGFKLPAAMVYSLEKSDPSLVPNISTSEMQAVAFVQNVMMRAVYDVLHQQGRGAGLSDDVISLIFNQLDITVKYLPLKCDKVFIDAMGAGVVLPMKLNCQIISGTVKKTCMPMAPAAGQGQGNQAMCDAGDLKDINPKHLNISGSITTTNIIMANWSTQMWQTVLNRALRSLSAGPLSSDFIGASITLI